MLEKPLLKPNHGKNQMILVICRYIRILYSRGIDMRMAYGRQIQSGTHRLVYLTHSAYSVHSFDVNLVWVYANTLNTRLRHVIGIEL